MPASASAPPEGISTVVSARRTFSDGMVKPEFTIAPSVESSETSVVTFRLMRPSDSTTGMKARLMPNFLNSTVGVHGLMAWQDTPVDDREFAAGQEVRSFAGDRRQIRFGQRADHAGALHRPQRRVDRVAILRERAGDPVGLHQRRSVDRERILVVEIEHCRADADGAVQIDADLLDHIALHFGDGDPQIDLVAVAHGDRVHHLVAGSGRAQRCPGSTRRPAIENAVCASAGVATVPDSTMPSAPSASTRISAVGST